MDIGLPQHDTPQGQYLRDRNLAAQCQFYDWSFVPGLPPLCKGTPEPEKFTPRKRDRVTADLLTSILNSRLAWFDWRRKNKRKLKHYDSLYVLEKPPAVIKTWTQDRVFADQRINGVNPFLITCVDAIPEHFPVDDESVRGVLPEGVTIAQLLGERRLFICDWRDLADVPLVFGRFGVAPMALFWLDQERTLMPLAIQLGQSPTEAPVIFTPADDWWVWLTARSYVASADGSYHEVVAHLTRTHLVMEPVWVAACRTLPPQHPIHELLAPHFTGTIHINTEALTDMLAPGGPIDVAMAIGSEGAFWLIDKEYDRWRFDDWNPIADLERRGVLDSDVLPGFHYRDDALRLFGAIGSFIAEIVDVYYKSDADVVDDYELQSWAQEMIDEARGGVRASSISNTGTFDSKGELIEFLGQVVFTVSASHAAVNNGQWDQFGYIPSTPGALYMPAPTSKEPSSEARLTYALPDMRASISQMTLVHLLSQPTITPLGSYPEQFFTSSIPAQNTVDRFRSRLDDITEEIVERNRRVANPYNYLIPSDVGRSIAI